MSASSFAEVVWTICFALVSLAWIASLIWLVVCVADYLGRH